MTADNPALRLSDIFELISDLPPSMPIDKAWGKVLIQNEDAEPSAIFPAFTKVVTLVSQIVDLLLSENTHLEGPVRTWESGTYSALHACNLVSDRKVIHFVNDIKPHKDFLVIAGALIQKGNSTKAVEAGKILDLIGDFETLKKEIECSKEMSDQVKTYLIAALIKIISALSHYHITGQADVLGSLEQFTGKIILDDNIASEVKRLSLSDRIFKVIAGATAVFGLVIAGQKILLNVPPVVDTIDGFVSDEASPNDSKGEGSGSDSKDGGSEGGGSEGGGSEGGGSEDDDAEMA